MKRLRGDAPGPGQGVTRGTNELGHVLREQGNTISVRWVPGHRGIAGYELADMYARAAAESEFVDPSGRGMAARTSLSFLRCSATERAT